MNTSGIMHIGGEFIHNTTLDRELDIESISIGIESDVLCGLMIDLVNTSDLGGIILICIIDIHGLSIGQNTTDISEECIMLKESLCTQTIGHTGEIGGVSEGR